MSCTGERSFESNAKKYVSFNSVCVLRWRIWTINPLNMCNYLNYHVSVHLFRSSDILLSTLFLQ
jgi:hypothetical protein